MRNVNLYRAAFLISELVSFYLTDEECKFRCVIRLDALLNRFYLTDEECKL